MVSSLYNKAKETNADIVMSDYFLSFKNKDIYKKLDYSENLEDNISSFIGGRLGYLWNKLIRRELYTKNNIYPPIEISVWEDRWLLTRLFMFATNLAYVPKAFLHHWKQNVNAISNNVTDKTWDDLRWYVVTTKEFLQERGVYEQYKDLFLIKNLSYVLWRSQGKGYNEKIKYVSPESNKFNYLYIVSNGGVVTKCIFSLYYKLKLDFLVIFLLRCKGYMKKILKNN